MAAGLVTCAIFAHERSLWIYGGLLLFKAAVLAYCFFDVEGVGDGLGVTIAGTSNRSDSVKFEGSRTLQIAWLSALAFGLTLWVFVPGATNMPRILSSVDLGDDSGGGHSTVLPPGVSVWLDAIETNKPASVQAVASDTKATLIFKDPVWGKHIFFMATDASPAILEAILQRVDVPEEFVMHSFARLASQGNCRAFVRLIRYAKQRQLSGNAAAGSSCRGHSVAISDSIRPE